MKQLLFIFPVTLILSGVVYGQDSTATPDSAPTQAPVATRSYGTGSRGYGSEGYGGRAEVFVTGFGLLTSHASGNSIDQQATESGGFAAGYQFRLNSWSALEGRYGFSRNSQKYDLGGVVSSIPAYLSEITGSYVYRFPKVRRLQPFLEGGGGLVHFSPGNYGNGSNTANGSNNAGGTPTTGSGGSSSGPGPYVVVSNARLAVPLATPVYNGSTPGVASQSRPAFVYGVGVDFPAFSHFSFRLEYRGLGYKTPDFNQTGLQTDAYSFLSEPTFGVAYRF